MGKELLKQAKATVKAEKQAQKKENRKKFWSVAKHYVIAGAIVAIAFGLYQFRVLSYNQGYNDGVKDGKATASEVDATVITRVREIKALISELK